jgi:prepilin-type N-terminal cleavage/methylation domain-containing protein
MRSQALLKSRGLSLLEVIVALAILGIGVVALIQLFSIDLRTAKKSGDYSKALIYGRSMLDEAYSYPEPEDAAGSFDSGEYSAETTVELIPSEDKNTQTYEITVTVTWPPKQTLKLQGRKILHEKKKE